MKIAGEAQAELIKVAAIVIGVAVVAYVAKKAITGLVKAPGELIGKAWDSIAGSAREGGAAWQEGYVPNPDYSNEGRNYVSKYSNPLVNEQGYDFGQLSG